MAATPWRQLQKKIKVLVQIVQAILVVFVPSYKEFHFKVWYGVG